MYGREEFLMYLNKAFTDKGSFTLLLGGKNVGKSNVLKSLARVANKSSDLLVLYVDGRLCPGHLENGLANGIAQLVADQGKKRGLQAVLGIIDECKLLKRSRDNVEGVSQKLIETFMGIAKNRNAFPVLIIDEADIVLGIDSNGEVFDQTKNLLTSFVSNTKHRMNLILVSTDHAYPCRLEREGFNLQNVYNTIFAAEISPKEMWKLLVSATYEEGDNNGKAMIGMGPHLAELCIAAYGGHIWTVEGAIQGLAMRQDEAEASVFLPDLSSKIIRCLKTHPTSRPLLEAMARYGLAPIRTQKCYPSMMLVGQSPETLHVLASRKPNGKKLSIQMLSFHRFMVFV
jgi:energy-coupling factor transporter ATP-binding protein EcfA2